MMPKLILYKDAAERLTALGVPTSIRAIQRWGDRSPPLKRKLAGRGVLRAEALELIVAGKSLPDVATAMRVLAAKERRLSDGGGTGE